MLEKIFIRGRNIYPQIDFNQETGFFQVSGRSLPEDVDAFYIPVISWLEKYVQDPSNYTEFVFKFDYYNSSTARKIIDIMLMLERISHNFDNKKVKVIWYYDDGDEVMKDNGDDFKNVIKVDFEVRLNEKTKIDVRN